MKTIIEQLEPLAGKVTVLFFDIRQQLPGEQEFTVICKGACGAADQGGCEKCDEAFETPAV